MLLQRLVELVGDHRDAEIGTYLATGQPCGTMIELDPLLLVGDAPETQAASLRVGKRIGEVI